MRKLLAFLSVPDALAPALSGGVAVALALLLPGVWPLVSETGLSGSVQRFAAENPSLASLLGGAGALGIGRSLQGLSHGLFEALEGFALRIGRRLRRSCFRRAVRGLRSRWFSVRVSRARAERKLERAWLREAAGFFGLPQAEPSQLRELALVHLRSAFPEQLPALRAAMRSGRLGEAGVFLGLVFGLLHVCAPFVVGGSGSGLVAPGLLLAAALGVWFTRAARSRFRRELVRVWFGCRAGQVRSSGDHSPFAWLPADA